MSTDIQEIEDRLKILDEELYLLQANFKRTVSSVEKMKDRIIGIRRHLEFLAEKENETKEIVEVTNG